MAWAEAYPRIKWHLDPSSRLATTHGPKIGGCCARPLLERRTASPSNTMWPGAKAYLRAKFRLDSSNRFVTIDLHQRYRQAGQADNGPIAQGEPFYKRSPKKVILLSITLTFKRCDSGYYHVFAHKQQFFFCSPVGLYLAEHARGRYTGKIV